MIYKCFFWIIQKSCGLVQSDLHLKEKKCIKQVNFCIYKEISWNKQVKIWMLGSLLAGDGDAKPSFSPSSGVETDDNDALLIKLPKQARK